jgi:hypothetical protein
LWSAFAISSHPFHLSSGKAFIITAMPSPPPHQSSNSSSSKVRNSPPPSTPIHLANSHRLPRSIYLVAKLHRSSLPCPIYLVPGFVIPLPSHPSVWWHGFITPPQPLLRTHTLTHIHIHTQISVFVIPLPSHLSAWWHGFITPPQPLHRTHTLTHPPSHTYPNIQIHIHTQIYS